MSGESISIRFAPILGAAVLACACGTAALGPLADPDPEVRCPGVSLTWGLEVRDLRADRRDSERVAALIRESLAQSFPACRWQTGASAETPAILIEVHSFSVARDGNFWDSAAEWTVVARDSSGSTLTEFQSEAQVSRPNYRGANNEAEALKQVFDQVMRRTLAGLRALSPAT